MENAARVLTDKEFRQITVKELLTDRALMRDVHLTILVSGGDETSAIADLLSKLVICDFDPGGIQMTIRALPTFTVNDDPVHKYFFENDWQLDCGNFLNPGDIIPSGLVVPDTSKENMERVLSQLKAEGATTEMVQMKPKDLEKIFRLSGDKKFIKEQIKANGGLITEMPIDSLEMLMGLVSCRNERIINLLGVMPVMFNKLLKRIDGAVIERYNQKLISWEIITRGHGYKPAVGLNVTPENAGSPYLH